jgi:arylsulfatase A-like enzyme
VRPHYGVVTDRYKLVHFYGPDTDYWELFDRQSDPHELTSVYDESSYAEVRQELESELARLREDLKVPDEEDPAASGRGPGPRAQKGRKQKAGGKQP